MADFNNLEFSRVWTSAVDFPTYQDDEATVRADMQALYDEIKNYINETLIPDIQQALVDVVVGAIADGSVTTAKLASDCVAPSAAKLATARNVSIANSDSTGPGSAVSFDGSGNLVLLLPATIKAALNGNAATATALRNNTVTGPLILGGADTYGTEFPTENLTEGRIFFKKVV